jgi:hypothetical protein
MVRETARRLGSERAQHAPAALARKRSSERLASNALSA